MGWIALTAVLALTVLVLGLSLLSLRRALREVAEELEEKLAADTNTLITLSTGDRAVRALTARINTQLHALRAERLRLRNGDRELKAAVTNVSHDLRTPLTAICGYLDLLEGEEHSADGRRYLAVIRERTEAMRSLTEELFRYSVLTAPERGAGRNRQTSGRSWSRAWREPIRCWRPGASPRRSVCRRGLSPGAWTLPPCGGPLITSSATPPSTRTATLP